MEETKNNFYPDVSIVSFNRDGDILYRFYSYFEDIGINNVFLLIPKLKKILINKKLSLPYKATTYFYETAKYRYKVDFQLYLNKKSSELFYTVVFVPSSFSENILKLYNSERRYKLLAENSAEIIWTMDLEGNYIYISPSVYNLQGYTTQEAVKMTIKDHISPKYAGLIEAEVKRAFSELALGKMPPPSRYEVELIKKDGSTIMAEVVAKLLFNEKGMPIGVQGSTRDITDRKKAEEAVLLHEKKLSTVLDTMPAAVFELNSDFQITYCNDFASMMFHVKMNPDCDGADFFEITSFCESVDVIKSFLEDNTKKRIEPVEYKYTNEEGRDFYLLVNFSKTVSSTENILCFYCVMTDITELKREREMAIIREKQLIQADKMITLGRLVSGVAHEVNNPNNFIRFNSSLIKKIWKDVKPVADKYLKENGDFSAGGSLYSSVNEEITGFIDSIEQGTHRIQKIVEDLKSFARQDSGTAKHELNINEAINNTIYIIKNLIKKSTSNFRFYPSMSDLIIIGSFHQIEQVFLNLISNACEAVKDNKTLITVKSYFDAELDKVCVEIVDEGKGINTDDLNSIMDPFFTTKQEVGGTGLGLSIVYTILSNHKGELKYESKEGEYTKVLVLIPGYEKTETKK